MGDASSRGGHHTPILLDFLLKTEKSEYVYSRSLFPPCTVVADHSIAAASLPRGTSRVPLPTYVGTYSAVHNLWPPFKRAARWSRWDRPPPRSSGAERRRARRSTPHTAGDDGGGDPIIYCLHTCWRGGGGAGGGGGEHENGRANNESRADGRRGFKGRVRRTEEGAVAAPAWAPEGRGRVARG